MIVIEEVLGRSEQGITRPFICRGNDGHIYFVKGIGAGRRSQICEWVAAQLATIFGLPIAPYALVEVPETLVDFVVDGQLLGSGVAFASQQLPHVQELNVASKERVSPELASQVLVFDWWLKNEDRHLTKFGGNPNLLWNTQTEQMVVIDHNLAFDQDFNATQFLDSHVFASSWSRILSDSVLRHECQEKMWRALVQLEEIRNSIPETWWSAGVDIPVNITWEEIAVCLTRCQTDALWEFAK